MTDDLVTRLRAHDINLCPEWRDKEDQHAWCDRADALLSEAAAEIERLSALVYAPTTPGPRTWKECWQDEVDRNELLRSSLRGR